MFFFNALDKEGICLTLGMVMGYKPFVLLCRGLDNGLMDTKRFG
jgi:hypothetical protein